MRSIRLYFIVFTVVCVLFPAGSWSATPEGREFGELKIRYFAAGKKVIPAVCQIGNWKIVDIKLPDIVVENRGKRSVTIESIDAVGKNGGRIVAATRMHPDELTAAAGKIVARIKQKSPIAVLQISYGDIVLPEGKLAESSNIGPDESAVLPLSTIAYLHYTGQTQIESMELAIRIRNGKTSKVLKYPVKLTHYKQKGHYIFPLKGDLHIAFSPLSYIHHRAAHSQEFGFDVVGAAQKGADFTEISTPQPKTLSDFSIWGRDVLAIGDGTVVDMGDKFPEAPMSDPDVYGKPGYVQNLLMSLVGKIGFTNAVAGNYIIIDHHNGEFSTYCHLKEGSIRVKKGEQVKQGAVIAQVGNTGNSGAPHLHFQIMDGMDFKTANGLPVMFENLPGTAIINVYPVKANTIGFSDNVFFTIK
jgi:hypothetical protein